MKKLAILTGLILLVLVSVGRVQASREIAAPIITPNCLEAIQQTDEPAGYNEFSWTVTLPGVEKNYGMEYSTNGKNWSDSIDWSDQNDPVAGGGWSGPITTTSYADNGGNNLWVRWANHHAVKTGPVVNNLGLCSQITPTPEPTVTPTPCTENCGNPPTFQGSTTEAPVCSDGSTTQLPANSHVIRSGSNATVNFFMTEGDSANIYWRVVGSSDWQNAVSDVKPNSDKFVSYTIHDLNPALGYDFGIQQKQGCGGGQLVTAVVVDGPKNRLFTFTYWEWSK